MVNPSTLCWGSPRASRPTAVMVVRPLGLLGLLLLSVSCGGEAVTVSTTEQALESAHVVVATEHSFSPATLSLDRPGAVELRNNGGLAHTWTVLASPIASESELSEAEVIVEARAEVGQAVTVDLTGLDPGTYQVVCAIPGHLSAGMEGELVISEG